MIAKFDWDSGNFEKCQSHGVSIDEIEMLFVKGPRIAPDPKHSDVEDRLIAIGSGLSERPLFVAFTLRVVEGVQVIRPIGARYMHSKEAARYGSEGSQTPH